MSVLLDGTVNGFAEDGSSAHFSFDSANPFTIAFWVKTTASGTKIILANRDGTDGWQVAYSDDSANKVEMEIGTATPVAPAVANDGVWHSVVIVQTGGTTTVYQDNVAGTGLTGVVTTGAGNTFRIGSQASTGSLLFPGTLAKVAIYNNYAFTIGDRLSYYTSGGVTIPASPQARYLFANGALNTDSSGNSHDLTPHGTGAGWTYSSSEPPTGAVGSGFFLATH